MTVPVSVSITIMPLSLHITLSIYHQKDYFFIKLFHTKTLCVNCTHVNDVYMDIYCLVLGWYGLWPHHVESLVSVHSLNLGNVKSGQYLDR